MSSLEMESADPKRAAVLAAAVGVFGRYGFQKTSMEAVAKAAGISRPGLYLLFPNKEQLYRATMHDVLDRAQRAMEAHLADQTVSFDQRIVAGLDALMGPYIDTQVARDLNELLENSEPQLGTMFSDYQDRARAALRVHIDDLAPPGLLDGGLSADDIVELIFSAALTWKSTSATRKEFRDRIRRSLRLIHRAAG
ncbi:TetR/AcrR family transcriptional regulator [Micromonospora sp. CPCC 205539]|uniref:TetR/AcrR family transcriptional regulator n=1 Tax=Micromonospora sp. CPCC 205539 TaxID=3122408 RepID=UPI002FF2C589